jgi:hypothetical protein
VCGREGAAVNGEMLSGSVVCVREGEPVKGKMLCGVGSLCKGRRTSKWQKC